MGSAIESINKAKMHGLRDQLAKAKAENRVLLKELRWTERELKKREDELQKTMWDMVKYRAAIGGDDNTSPAEIKKRRREERAGGYI